MLILSFSLRNPLMDYTLSEHFLITCITSGHKHSTFALFIWRVNGQLFQTYHVPQSHRLENMYMSPSQFASWIYLTMESRINRTDSSSDRVSTLTQSLQAKTIPKKCQNRSLTSNTLCLYLVEWSDAFKPSSSIKSNRGSVWLKTITISPPHNKRHCMTNTYPIAI
jgi:hypothetical protein